MESMHAGVGARADLIVVGVDTHKHAHVAVALDLLGRRLDEINIPATADGYAQLERWAHQIGQVHAFGIEGTGSYGAGLSRFLLSCGLRVLEVDRPDRKTRYKRGKDDSIDAESAARAVLGGTATTEPKTGDSTVEMIRMLKLAKGSATKARTQAMNQIKSVLVNAPCELRESMHGLTGKRLLEQCSSLRVTKQTTPTHTAKYTLRTLARRHQALHREVVELTAQIKQLVTTTAPHLLGVIGVGPDNAAALMICAGDNPGRLRSEAAFAALCGVSPVPASSGRVQNRYRLNRGGDRQANCALHRIVIVRLRWHQPSRDYMERRLAEGKTTTEIIRCLKRYTARELYHQLSTHARA